MQQMLDCKSQCDVAKLTSLGSAHFEVTERNKYRKFQTFPQKGGGGHLW